MTTLRARQITRGRGCGRAMVSRMPLNITAAHTKVVNLLFPPTVMDRHHDLYGRSIWGRVLVVPTCIGSTVAGALVLTLMYYRLAPAAVILTHAESLLVSGAILADVWYGRSLPVVECREADLFDKIHDGDLVEVDADRGEIVVRELAT